MTNQTTTDGQMKYYTFFAVLFVAILLITNIAAQKLIPVGPFVFTAGILLFPISYIFGDVLTEVYGYSRTRRIIWLGFSASVIMALFLALVIQLPAAPGWEMQEAFKTVLGQVPRVVAASLIAYLAGEFVNSYVMSRMKVKGRGGQLWKRTIASTIAGQAIDTILFAVIAFWGIVPNSVLFTAIWSGYLFKVLYEVLFTPITLKVVDYVKKQEGIDVFDDGINYNPFKVET